MTTFTTLQAALVATVTLSAIAMPRYGAADGSAPTTLLDPFQVTIANPVTRQRVQLALKGAAEQLASSECQKVFTDFRDGEGQPLQSRLDGLHLTGAAFLVLLRFTDGEGLSPCTQTTHIAAFTQPGSRVVRICGVGFGTHDPWDSRAGRVLLIHELLHSLGLHENPPSSSEITLQVRARCGPQNVQRQPI